MVEASIITPVLFLFIFAIFEFGFAFRNYLAVANTTRDGVREASVAGNVADADYRILRSVNRASAALPDSTIQRIIVFKAADENADINDSTYDNCRAGSSDAGVCNVYTVADLSRPVTDFGCQQLALGDPLDSPDLEWCPTDRIVSVGTGLDFIGVHVVVRHDYITGLFGNTITFEDTTILQVEPQDI